MACAACRPARRRRRHLPNFYAGAPVEFLGIGSVAVGFAFRDILQNFLAGILLLLTEPFRIGDQIVVGSYEGTVEEIQTRATMIQTYDGRRVVIPNADLFVDSVIVNTANESRRLEYILGIGYGDDVEEARQLIYAALVKCSTVLLEPKAEVLLSELAPSSVNLLVRWWIAPPRRRDAFDSKDEVLTAIKQQMNAHGVDCLILPTRCSSTTKQKKLTVTVCASAKAGLPVMVTRPRASAVTSGRPAAPGVQGDRMPGAQVIERLPHEHHRNERWRGEIARAKQARLWFMGRPVKSMMGYGGSDRAGAWHHGNITAFANQRKAAGSCSTWSAHSSTRVFDGGFGAQGASLLVTLLDAGGFVVDLQRRGDLLSERS